MFPKSNELFPVLRSTPQNNCQNLYISFRVTVPTNTQTGEQKKNITSFVEVMKVEPTVIQQETHVHTHTHTHTAL